MAEKFLLPCGCGRFIPIRPCQAGESIFCECGVVLQSPTMLEITMLDPAPAEADDDASTPAWDAKSRLRLLGAVLVCTAFFGAGCLLWHRPVSRFQTIDPVLLRESAKELSPLQTWNNWIIMKEGLDRRIDQQYAAAVLRFRTWQIVIVAIGLVGVALLAASLRGKPSVTASFGEMNRV